MIEAGSCAWRHPIFESTVCTLYIPTAYRGAPSTCQLRTARVPGSILHDRGDGVQLDRRRRAGHSRCKWFAFIIIIIMGSKSAGSSFFIQQDCREKMFESGIPSTFDKRHACGAGIAWALSCRDAAYSPRLHRGQITRTSPSDSSYGGIVLKVSVRRKFQTAQTTCSRLSLTSFAMFVPPHWLHGLWYGVP